MNRKNLTDNEGNATKNWFNLDSARKWENQAKLNYETIRSDLYLTVSGKRWILNSWNQCGYDYYCLADDAVAAKFFITNGYNHLSSEVPQSVLDIIADNEIE